LQLLATYYNHYFEFSSIITILIFGGISIFFLKLTIRKHAFKKLKRIKVKEKIIPFLKKRKIITFKTNERKMNDLAILD
jgi:hypothetical protein